MVATTRMVGATLVLLAAAVAQGEPPAGVPQKSDAAGSAAVVRAATRPSGLRSALGLARRARAYFRIPRSAEVSASENAGRANSRSAYFISGAAGLGIAIP